MVPVATAVAFGKGFHLQTIVGFIRDKVNYTGYRLAAVQSCGTIGNNIETLDGDGWNQAINVFIDQTLAVKQCQCRAGTKAAQVNTAFTGICALNCVGNG